MKQSDLYRQNAENCTEMAESARGEPAYNRYKRMEAAWLALAEEQDWLDGEQSPVGPDKGLKAKGNRTASLLLFSCVPGNYRTSGALTPRHAIVG